MRSFRKIFSLTIAVLLLLCSFPITVTEAVAPSLKSGSSLTVDDRGYLRGIWGASTVEKLSGEFDGELFIYSKGKLLPRSSTVASGDSFTMNGRTVFILIYGDADRNGRINLADVTSMLKSIAGWDIDICSPAADVAMNGRVNIADVSSLLKWIAGWDITLADAVYPKTEIQLNGNFKIVLPVGYDTNERDAAELLSKALDTVYYEEKGNSRIITDDGNATLEILVGDTCRTRSADALEKLGEFDWSYDIVTAGTVVITGSDSIGTYKAACAFVWDMFGYVDEHNIISSYNKWNGSEYVTVNTSKTLTTGTKYTYDHTDSDKPLTLGEKDVSEYAIVDQFGNSDAAEYIHREILRLTGNDLEIRSLKNEGDSPAIRVGVGKENGEFLIGLSTNVFAIGQSGDDVVIDVLNKSSLLYAARVFSAWYLEGDMALRDGHIKYGGIGSNLLVEKSCTERDIADGITYSAIEYTDSHGLPVLAYLVKADRGAERVMMGTKDNGYEVYNAKATVMDAINAAEDDGIDIAAGINADFFLMGSDYSPVGLCVKDGQILNFNSSARPWIAVMKDGTFDCGIAGEARNKIYDMKEGFGASHVLIKNGMVYQDGVGESFGMIRHPRTAMGYDGEGNVYLLVVDGRRPKLSNGASLLDLTIIFRDLGITSGVNLDGGGSSAMVVDDGGFKVANSPSDGALRKVFNSVLIMK